jgi:prevent-host-death family protein
MKTMSATEASRSFASLLDEAERGGTIVVTRGGRRIATIGPATAGNGVAVAELLASADIDEDFAADVLAARELVVSEAPAWPAD